MAQVGTLEVRIAADSRDFNEGIRKAASRLNTFEGRAGKASRSIQKMSTQMGAAAKRVSIAFTALGGAGAAALVGLTRSSLQTIDAQAKLADRIGTSIDSLRSLQLAARDAGVPLEKMGDASERLNSRLAEAARGTGTAVKGLEILRLTTEDFIGLDVDQRFALIADRARELGLTTGQLTDAMRQFGIRNEEIVNLLLQGGAAIRGYRERLEALGLSLSRVDAAKIERANDAMAQLGDFIESAGNGLAVAFSPAIQAAAGYVEELALEFGGLNKITEAAGDAMVDAALDAVEWIQEANVAVAEWALTWLQLQAAAAGAGAAVREFFGGEMTAYQRDVIAAVAAQEEFIAGLREMGSVADEMRERIEAARSGGDDGNNPLEMLIGGGVQETSDGLAAKKEVILEHFDWEAANLQEHLDRLNEMRENAAERERREEERRARMLERIEEGHRRQKEKTARLTIGLLTTMGRESKAAALAAIALNAGLQIGQTVQNTATAQMRALAELGPIAGPPMAAKIGAWGAANVALIAAQNLSRGAMALSSGPAVGAGAGAGSGGGGGGVEAQGVVSQQPTQTFRVEGFQRGDLVSGDSVVEALNEASKRGLVPEFAS